MYIYMYRTWNSKVSDFKNDTYNLTGLLRNGGYLSSFLRFKLMFENKVLKKERKRNPINLGCDGETHMAVQ